MTNKPIYKLVDGKGRVLIPKALRDAAKMEYGDIVRLGLADGRVTVRKVDIVEAGDQSPEAVEAYVRAAFKSMPDATRLELIGELSTLLQKRRDKPMRIFTHEDCDQTGFGFSLKIRWLSCHSLCCPKIIRGSFSFAQAAMGRIPIPLGGRYFWFPCPPESSAGSCAAM